MANTSEAIALVEKCLLLLGCADQPLRDFDGVYVYSLSSASDDTRIGLDAVPADVENVWGAKFTMSHPDVHAGLVMTNCRSIHWSKVRNASYGKAEWEAFSTMDLAVAGNDGKVLRFPQMTFGHVGSVCRMIAGKTAKDGSKYIPECLKWCTHNAQFAIAHYLFEPSWWVVKVAIESGCPKISLATDPIGVKEAWKLRDVPEGKRRRDALLHWVDAHWRQNRTDPDVEGYVRKHLRGRREFTQAGLSLQIKESEVDYMRLANEMQSRKVMARNKTDRRKRNRRA